MAKSRQVQTIQQIQLSTGFSEKFKKQLDALDVQDIRPLALTQWARRTFSIGRDEGYTDGEIVNCIQVYAYDRNYSARQIRRIIEDNGLSTYDNSYRSSSGNSANMSVYQSLRTYKAFVMGSTNMEESEIMNADYSPQKIRKYAHENLLDWISHMSEADLREFHRWMTLMDALVQDALKILEQKKVTTTKYGR